MREVVKVEQRMELDFKRYIGLILGIIDGEVEVISANTSSLSCLRGVGYLDAQVPLILLGVKADPLHIDDLEQLQSRAIIAN